MARSWRTGRDWSSWPVLMMLVTVLTPSLGVVWMMRAAMENERLAGRQRLADAYRVQLESQREQLIAEWGRRHEMLQTAAAGKAPAAAFFACLQTGAADSVVIAKRGEVQYPNVGTPSAADGGEAWRLAQRMEFAGGDYQGAADAYAAIVETADDETLAALAEQAHARCLVRLGREAEAISVLQRLRQRPGPVDPSGRSLAADAELRLLELMAPKSAEATAVAEGLRQRLASYDDETLPANQRRFLMHRLQELTPRDVPFATLAAEDLAAELLTAEPQFATGAGRRDVGLQLTALPGVWSEGTHAGHVVALHRTSSIASWIGERLAATPLPEGMTMAAIPPGDADGAGDALSVVAIGSPLGGWRLAMRTDGGQGVDGAASRQVLLAGVAAALLSVTLMMTWFAVAGVRRQMRTARLKNDLVATVSHELKTPLASIRLLVDSLISGAGGSAPPNGAPRDYLVMISKENARLTRLIDNFLTFSRMDRGKQRFACEPVDVTEVIEQAVAAVSDRFDGHSLTVELPYRPDEPSLWVRGDVDALVTAVVNLLDNAWKYTGTSKVVRLSARRVGGWVEIEAADNGPGLSTRVARRVFDRFYQVDQQLSRSQGGCGLGLSIVAYIVEAHGGKATVDSRPGEGCRFTIALRADRGAGAEAAGAQVRGDAMHAVHSDAGGRA